MYFFCPDLAAVPQQYLTSTIISIHLCIDGGECGKKSSECSSCGVTRLPSDDRNTRRCLVWKTCAKVRMGCFKKAAEDKNSDTWATCHMTEEVGAVLT